jgi:hypothetical protein
MELKAHLCHTGNTFPDSLACHFCLSGGSAESA